jgi:hypothetical protein
VVAYGSGHTTLEGSTVGGGTVVMLVAAPVEEYSKVQHHPECSAHIDCTQLGSQLTSAPYLKRLLGIPAELRPRSSTSQQLTTSMMGCEQLSQGTLASDLKGANHAAPSAGQQQGPLTRWCILVAEVGRKQRHVATAEPTEALV